MIRAVDTSITGLNTSQALLNVTSNNLANVNTTGFKAGRATFQDLFFLTVLAPGAIVAQGVPAPSGLQIGTGAVLASTNRSFTQGTLQQAGSQFDLAINGNGLFQVALPDGSIQYTRDGTFHVGPNGQLVNALGFAVQPPIVIPANSISVSISSAGVVTVTDPTNTRQVGVITLANFANPPGLSAVGNNLFAATPQSGPAVVSPPGQNGAGAVQQGMLEGSNADTATELTNLLIAQRFFAFNSEAITVESQLLLDTTSIIS